MYFSAGLRVAFLSEMYALCIRILKSAVDPCISSMQLDMESHNFHLCNAVPDNPFACTKALQRVNQGCLPAAYPVASCRPNTIHY